MKNVVKTKKFRFLFKFSFFTTEHQNKEPEIEDEFDKKRLIGELFLESRLPRMNKTAVTINEIYQLTDLIDESLLNRMDDEALAVLNIEDFSKE